MRVLSDPRTAAAVLRAGGLVGMPTETVYGLAADAGNLNAVGRVFAVKGRPADHPLIVHLPQREALTDWVTEVPRPIAELIDTHWPGPLTVVLPKQSWVPPEITGGLDTVALRVPAHPVALELLNALSDDLSNGRPIGVVAPSANRFGQVSPTTAAHVVAGLGGRLGPSDAVLDGGPCGVGVESTIVAMVDGRLRVLRPGAVVLPERRDQPEARDQPDRPSDSNGAPRVPGSLAAHYAPRTPVLLATAAEVKGAEVEGAEVEGAEVEGAEVEGAGDTTRASLIAHQELTPPIGLLAPADVKTPTGWHRLAAPTDDAAYARMLYTVLRTADASEIGTLVAVAPHDGPLRAAIVDRLTRAAAGSAARR